MELRHLRHFLALAEERSFTRAAARELIVQSGLSSSVRALEKDVGALLFVRGTRPVRLTPAGEALVPAARQALDAAEAARQAVRDVNGVLTGRLRIGAMHTIGHTLPFSAWVARFALAHPGVDVTVRQLPAVRMLEMVADGELDCALVPVVPERSTGLDVVRLVAEPIVMACAPGHPLAAEREVTLDRLAGERFVDTPADWAIRVQVDRAFQDAGLVRRTVCEVDEWPLVLDLVAAGVGIALVPEGLDFPASPRPAAALRLVPLAGITLLRRVDLVSPKGHAAGPAARRFLEQVRGSLRTQDAARTPSPAVSDRRPAAPSPRSGARPTDRVP
ncbi:LysR family transcriptional regulator [Actinacidiphila glaucinigra]|uniref:LysR family transcriptional regulator n=1 Tax=Actinacidiphila glaucinigra TaxID=235986 RepID=UPI0033BC025C